MKRFASIHFWILAGCFAVGIILHYPEQILHISTSSVFSSLGFTRHSFERILSLFPISYASYIFGKRVGFISLAISAVIMLPRAFLISESFPDAMTETIGVVFIGSMIIILFDRYHKEKERDQQLLTSERRYHELFESAHDAIWTHDLNGNILAANKAASELNSYNLSDLHSMNVKSFMTPDSLALAGQIRRSLLAGEPVEQPYEQHIIKRDGSEAVLKLSTSVISEAGKPIGFQNIARDVTSEKKMQAQLQEAYEQLRESHERLKESQQQLIQVEKLTSLGQLSASIAHEINNPLSGVLTYTQLLIKLANNNTITAEKALGYLSKMEFELIRTTKLVKNLLDFARQSKPALQQVHLNDIVNRAFDLVTHSAKIQDVQINKELDLALPDMTADPDQLLQVCTNLLLNAIQAMPHGGRLNVRTSLHEGQIKLEIQDTGVGISENNLHKLFTPFFTTKQEVKGVGLGLAVSYGIIQKHNGKIEVQSKEGVGTTFTVYLPLHRSETQPETANINTTYNQENTSI